MRNEIFTEAIGRPVRNLILVEVSDIFNEIKTSSGLILPNMAHEEAWSRSEGYSMDEFFIRKGKVVGYPKVISVGSFDHKLKEIEFTNGDIVYWNIVSFQGSQPIVVGDRKFLLVDIHEIILKITPDGNIVPIHGNVLFTSVKRDIKAFDYSVTKVTDRWKIHSLPRTIPEYENPRHYCDTNWEVGDEVLLSVPPFKLEGDIVRDLPEPLYACPVRFILCTA